MKMFMELLKSESVARYGMVSVMNLDSRQQEKNTGGSKIEPSPSLQNFGQGVPFQEVQWSGYQSSNPNLLASAFS